eukprot:CAMPEP_0172900248 /NCGR_PEP_ID=MMETSP1075-20121228/163644_1 /TAXON_ID=2916 /ORGANISM="Ceratium fusus, Strain PA161109" /LENGTH=93 /DNA_ID=CAMNT_0013756387 /DNA_START=160 /DNA_END=438 /DNA_ORIENTATION=+
MEAMATGCDAGGPWAHVAEADGAFHLLILLSLQGRDHTLKEAMLGVRIVCCTFQLPHGPALVCDLLLQQLGRLRHVFTLQLCLPLELTYLLLG